MFHHFTAHIFPSLINVIEYLSLGFFVIFMICYTENIPEKSKCFDLVKLNH